MEIKRIRIDDIKPAEYNPRVDLQPGDAEYDRLKNSIEHFGYVEPIILNIRTGNLVGGHQRLKVLKDLGYDEIDVVHVDLEDNDEKALNVALNKISGDWDADKLEDLLRELHVDNFDVELTGFDLDELDTMFNGSLEDIDDKNSNLNDLCVEDKEIINNKRNIQEGDIYELGKHRLYCGDAYNINNYNILVKGEDVAMIFTDPPYQYDDRQFKQRKAYISKLTYTKYKDTPITGSMIQKVYDEGFATFNVEDIEYLFNTGVKSMYFCCNRHDLINYINVGIKYKYKYDIHVLFKRASIPFHNANYLNDIEYIIYFRLPKATFNSTLKTEYYKHLQEDLNDDEIATKLFYTKATISYSAEGRGDSEIELEHPTIKPLRLIIPKIAISSNEGDIVVDLFGGSGSTLIACEKLNRACYMMELNPKYINETIDRWEAYTGNKAVKL